MHIKDFSVSERFFIQLSLNNVLLISEREKIHELKYEIDLSNKFDKNFEPHFHIHEDSLWV